METVAPSYSSPSPTTVQRTETTVLETTLPSPKKPGWDEIESLLESKKEQKREAQQQHEVEISQGGKEQTKTRTGRCDKKLLLMTLPADVYYHHLIILIVGQILF